MPTRSSPIHEANRLTAWQLMEIGREIRLGRITGGRTQRAVAESVGTSVARISRIERGLVPTVTLRQLSRIAAAVGLKLYIRASSRSAAFSTAAAGSPERAAPARSFLVAVGERGPDADRGRPSRR